MGADGAEHVGGGLGEGIARVAGDLTQGCRARIVVVMFHLTRDGRPKLVERCDYPLTAAGCVSTVVTDLAVVDIEADGFLLREVAPGVAPQEVVAVTGAPMRIAGDVHEMEFE